MAVLAHVNTSDEHSYGMHSALTLDYTSSRFLVPIQTLGFGVTVISYDLCCWDIKRSRDTDRHYCEGLPFPHLFLSCLIIRDIKKDLLNMYNKNKKGFAGHLTVINWLLRKDNSLSFPFYLWRWWNHSSHITTVHIPPFLWVKCLPFFFFSSLHHFF